MSAVGGLRQQLEDSDEVRARMQRDCDDRLLEMHSEHEICTQEVRKRRVLLRVLLSITNFKL
jgi:hypothetical protein